MTIEIIVRCPNEPALVTQTTEFRQPFGTGEQYTKSEITMRVEQGGEQTFLTTPGHSVRIDPLPPEVTPAPLFDYEAMYPPIPTSPVFGDGWTSPPTEEHHPLSGGELDTSGERRTPTHCCKECGAEWIFFGDDPITGGWSLHSPTCGKCCDNVAMGDQIAPIVPDVEPLDDMQRAGQDYDGEEIDPDLRA